jgi:hypothetical protein
MVDFHKVLDEIAERRRPCEAEAPSPRLSCITPQMATPRSCIAPQQAAAAYRRLQSTPLAGPLQAPSPVGRNFEDCLAEGALSRDRLKSLRRSIAWRLHPDRGVLPEALATAAMARFNAAIDAALSDDRSAE